MENSAPDPELLRSLGKLARGLSALFWGLPATLLVSAVTLRANFEPFGMVPPLAANLLLLFGLSLMGSFQKQERPWMNALDRAKLIGLVNLGLCPFLFWLNRMPADNYFRAAVFVLVLSSLLFLFTLNVVLQRLGAMLPDETLRHDINQFTALSRSLLVTWFVLVVLLIAIVLVPGLAARLGPAILFFVEHSAVVILLLVGLSPVAITMGLIWKTKEVIFDSVFGAK
jgi:hypothetical protein